MTTDRPALNDDAVRQAVAAAIGVVEYESEWEYGEAPESCDRVSNWASVIEAAVSSYVTCIERLRLGLPMVEPKIHDCCGCSCEVCEVGHNRLNHRDHTQECSDRFHARYAAHIAADADPDGDQALACACRRARHGHQVDWVSTCPRHGEQSAWYNSVAQVAARADEDRRRKLTQAVHAAVKAGATIIVCPACSELARVRAGNCLACGATRNELVSLGSPSRHDRKRR